MTFCNYDLEYYCSTCEVKMPIELVKANSLRISKTGRVTSQPRCLYCGRPVKTHPTKVTERVKNLHWRKPK